MRPRMIMLLLVPALVGTMVGVVMAAARPQGLARRGDQGGQGSQPPPVAAPTRPAVSTTPSDPPPATVTPSRRPTETRPAYDVAAVQRRLTDLRYYVGPVDGREGPSTRTAVMAFQKVNALSVDGAVGPQTLAALASPVTPTLIGGAPDRIEVDLTKQVLYYVSGGQLQRIMPVSSGNGRAYRTESGARARSLTPVGTYHIQRRIRGLREADLGSLYDPMYFYKGWAIHGSNSVPAYPASHGCIRVPRSDALWLFDRAPVGTQVVIYGGRYTFPAGSRAPGTDTPAGDTAADTGPASQPSPARSSPQPQPSPQPQASSQPQPSPQPQPSAAPSPQPPPSPEASPSASEGRQPMPPPLPGG